MIGYGKEDDHFVLELTYNYGIDKYELGNDFLGMEIQCGTVFNGLNKGAEGGVVGVKSPDGYKFLVTDGEPLKRGPVKGIILASTNLDKTEDFWGNILGLKVLEKSEASLTMGFSEDQAGIKFVKQGTVEHAKAYGRVAFAVPTPELKEAEDKAVAGGHQILTSLVTLKTEGKADVSVVIFSDPDRFEICFVGDEGFRDLSQFDPEGDALLDKAISEDKSSEWFARKGKSKAAA